MNGEMLIPGGKFGGADFPAGLEMLIPGGRFGTGDREIPGGILDGVLSISLLLLDVDSGVGGFSPFSSGTFGAPSSS